MSKIHRSLEFKKNVLDKMSPSMCAAKWLDATIWLYSGKTASCHHVPSHSINIDQIKNNISTLHNTEQKKMIRLEMQNGKRPSECEYCWKIEDLSPDSISDRVFKSARYNFSELQKLKELNHNADINPKTLEIAFDRTCNFACSYCSPSFSTRWIKDITENGPYTELFTDKNNHYTSTHEMTEFELGQNPYIEAFWKWWPTLQNSLTRLKITGGEPMMSPHFWQLIETFKKTPLNVNLAINTNLGSQDKLISKFIDESHFIPHLEVFTSNEAFGKQAEYIRDGLNYEKWVSNVERLLTDGNVKRLFVMMTINGLSLFSMTQLLDQLLVWKKKFGATTVTMSLNLLRFPNFQSPLVLPAELRNVAVERLKHWFEVHKNSDLVIEYEFDQLKRVINYLENETIPTEESAEPLQLEKDLKRFILQFDHRRNKNFRTTFEPIVVNWLDQIKIDG